MIGFVKRGAVNVLIAIDQLANAIAGGDPDETISSRAGKQEHRRRWAWFLCKLLHWIDPNHCADAIETDEGKDELFSHTRKDRNMKISVAICDIQPGEICGVELPGGVTTVLNYERSQIVVPVTPGDCLVSIIDAGEFAPDSTVTALAESANDGAAAPEAPGIGEGANVAPMPDPATPVTILDDPVGTSATP